MVQVGTTSVLPLHVAIESIALETIELTKKGRSHSKPYLVGDPGMGKTEMVRTFCAKKGYRCICLSPGLQPLERFSGIPDFVVKGEDGQPTTVWSVPEFIHQVKEVNVKSNDYETPIIIFFDDWHTADQEIQKIGFELFTYHKYSNYELPKNSYFILAGNEKSIAGAKIQLSAIRNRLLEIKVKPDLDYWIENYAIPKSIMDEGIAFFDSQEYQSYFQEKESANEPFGSPRQWVSAFNFIDNMRQKNGGVIDNSLLSSILRGSVSSAAATAFYEFYLLYSKVDTRILFESGKVVLPENASDLYAYLIANNNRFYSLWNEHEDVKKKIEISKKYKLLLEALQEKEKEKLTVLLKRLISKPGNRELGLTSGGDIHRWMIEKDIYTQSQIDSIYKNLEYVISVGS